MVVYLIIQPVSVLKGHSGNFFGGVFSSWGPYMAPKEWAIAKTRPKSRYMKPGRAKFVSSFDGFDDVTCA